MSTWQSVEYNLVTIHWIMITEKNPDLKDNSFCLNTVHKDILQFVASRWIIGIKSLGFTSAWNAVKTDECILLWAWLSKVKVKELTI